MRFYGVIEAFRQGRMPNNAQIDRTLKYVEEHSPVDESKLSPDGRKLVQDTRDVIETARLIVESKNADEIFQNFMWTTREVDVSVAKKDPKEVLPVDGDKLQQDKQDGACTSNVSLTHNWTVVATKHLRTLLNLIATNSEARKLLSDFSVLGRDILARATTHAAEAIRPDEEKLNQIDQSAPADDFRTQGDRTVGPNETPIPAVPIPGVDGAVTHEPEGGVRIQADGEKFAPEQVRDRAAQVAGDKAAEATDKGTTEAQRVAEYVVIIAWHSDFDLFALGKTSAALPQRQKRQALWTASLGFGYVSITFPGDRSPTFAQDGLLDRVPQEHKETARDKVEASKNVLLDEYFPEGRRDQFIYRGKKASGCLDVCVIFTDSLAGHCRVPAPRRLPAEHSLAHFFCGRICGARPDGRRDR
jgi:hypothetical protein